MNLFSPRRRPRIALALLALATSACALGTTTIAIGRTPLATFAGPTPLGDVVIERFADARPDDQRPYVGAKRNVYGMSLGHLAVPGDEQLAAILTRYTAEALRAAGYRVVDAEADAGTRPDGFAPMARLRGQIDAFWLDAHAATCHEVSVIVRLYDARGELLWEALVAGRTTSMLWIGATAELERVARPALDRALAEALRAFRSEGFRDAVLRGRERSEHAEGGAYSGLPSATGLRIGERETDPGRAR